jgi:organic hydroperoxide reductase OsmC/OhrA
MSTEGEFSVELLQQADYRFEARFDDAALPALFTDEPAPLGGGTGPDPARLLGVAVANCLAASLLFALRKFRNEPGPLRAVARVRKTRNAQGRLRIGRIDVALHLGVPQAALKLAERALAQFEDFCTVTQSVRGAIDVDVTVIDRDGVVLKQPAAAAPEAPISSGVLQP